MRILAAIIISLTVHEVAHIFAAIILRIKFSKVKVTIFGFNLNANIDNTSFVKKFILFFAGPLANITLYIFFKFKGQNDLSQVNIFLAFINLIPIIPLDGGNICKSFLELFCSTTSACRYMIFTNWFFSICFLFMIYLYRNWIFLILSIMSIKGIMETNKFILEKNIKFSYNNLRSKHKV